MYLNINRVIMAEETDADTEVDLDRETVQIRFSVNESWVHDELLPAYPSVTSLSQAARHAVLDGVETKQKDDQGMQASINSQVIEALQKLGGSVENCQTIRIGKAGEVEIDDVENVNIQDEE
jgi:hypothetical protein